MSHSCSQTSTALLALTMVVASCGGDTGEHDAGSGGDPDAAVGMDAGDRDADAGDHSTDSGPPDAGCGLACVATCEDAEAAGSHAGCSFWIVDLDNRAVLDGDPATLPFGVAVSNPGHESAEITVERDQALPGEPLDLATLATLTLPAGSAETIELGRFEVDGSSATGLNDGTHTALTANALRLRSSRPVMVQQVNPIREEGVNSVGVSLLLPEHMLGARYSVVGWPQTIADDPDLEHDFDPSSTDEDMRAFLTIVGTQASTSVTVTLGPDVVRVMGAGAIPESGPGDLLAVTLGPHEVLNLETGGFGADFSGSIVAASAPVAVFVGNEASDVPTFTRLFDRKCCADHLETQLAPDDGLGARFVIARTPDRTRALNAAFADPADAVEPVAEIDSVRVIATEPGTTTVTTSLPAPNDRFELGPREWIEIRQAVDYELEADQAVSVVQAVSSHGVVEIPSYFPGGDPSLFSVIPVEQFRREHVFVVPDGYPFDAVTIVAQPSAGILLDGAPLPSVCTTAPAGEWVVRRCPLSFPRVLGRGAPIEEGVQGDGLHVVTADSPVSVIVSGFATYTSYTFAAGRIAR